MRCEIESESNVDDHISPRKGIAIATSYTQYLSNGENNVLHLLDQKTTKP